LVLIFDDGPRFGPCRRAHVGFAVQGLVSWACFQRNIRSGGKMLLGSRSRDRWGLGDDSKVGPMGLSDIRQGLGVGCKPCLLAAGAADRTPGRPERGRRDLIGGSTIRAGDHHRRFAPDKSLLHASRPFVNGPETKGKPRAAELMALRPKGRRKAIVLAKVADSNAVGVAI
jgi:hypothetical protein